MSDNKLKKTRKIGDTEFIHNPEAFIDLLRMDESADIAKGSLIAAGSLVVEPLIKVLTDDQEDEKVQQTVIDILGEIGKPSLLPLMETLKEYKLDSVASSKIIGRISSALGKIGKEAVEPLIQALNSKLFQMRFAAAVALWQMRDPDGLDAIYNAIENGNERDIAMYKMIVNSP